MPTLHLLFNHTITPSQAEDARASLGVDRIEALPNDLKALWGQIPPDLEAIGDFLSPVREWLLREAKPGDFLLIQGDFGACYLMVRFAFGRGLIPVYATTMREAIEERQPDGSVRMTHHFKHQRFRRYNE